MTGRDRNVRRAHCYVSTIRQRQPHVSSYVRQGAGCSSTGSTGATLSIFLGRDSKARELRAELEGDSFIPTLTGHSHNVLRERPLE